MVASYLSDRQEFVYCASQSLDIIELTSRMSQGSVLALILFLLYIDNIACDINVTVRMFAEGWLVYKVINNKGDQIALNQALSKITYSEEL